MCMHTHRHLDQLNILGPENHEFLIQGKHFTESRLFLIAHNTLKYWDTRRQIDVAVLDFSKALTLFHAD